MADTRDPLGFGDLPRWLWLWFPFLIIVLQLIAVQIGGEFYKTYIHQEQGLVENATVLVLLIASFVAIRCALRKGPMPYGWVRPALWLLAVGAFFFAGEEASWGQHWFGWATPEGWKEFNERGETSLHNAKAVRGLVNEMPRLALSLAALIGGVLAPLLYAIRKPDNPSRAHAWLWPTIVCLPSAILALTITLPKKLCEDVLETDVPHAIAISPGESKEYFLGLFIWFYVASLEKRVGQWREATSAPA